MLRLLPGIQRQRPLLFGGCESCATHAFITTCVLPPASPF